MKKILKISILFSLILFASSCDETIDEVIYNGNSPENRTFLSFPATVFNLPVAIDATGSLDITLNSSTLTSSDRTFDVVLNTDPELTTADPATYTLPGTVTIPANSHQGTLTIDGVDNGLVDITPKQIVFSLGDLPDATDTDILDITINVFEVCPVPLDYLIGEYQIEDVIATVGPGNGTENFAAGTITITAPTETTRAFTVGILPAFAGERNVVISLICNTFNLENVDPNLSCDGATAYIFTGAGADNSLYSVNDDTSFIINYIEDPAGSCGGPFDSSFMLTKL